jgi:hypothetical protein
MISAFYVGERKDWIRVVFYLPSYIHVDRKEGKALTGVGAAR